MRRVLALLAFGLLGLGLGGCITTTTTTYGPPGMTASPPAADAPSAGQAT